MKKTWGKRRILAALLLSLLLLMTAGCGSGKGSEGSTGSGSGSVEELGETNDLPEDGIVTKEQFKTVAGEDKKVSFVGKTEDGITYTWTYDCSKIQNPDDQNLKIDFSSKDLDDIKKQANGANDALKLTMHGKGLICVPTLTVELPKAWQSNAGYLVKEQSGKLARMSDVTIASKPKSEKSSKKTDSEESTTKKKSDTKPVKGTTTLTMSVTSLDGDCYIIGGITEQQNKGATASTSTSGSTQTTETETADADTDASEADDGSGSVDASEGSGTGGGSSSAGGQDVANDEESASSSHTCTISISCSTILNNMDDLESGKSEFVPADGWILAASEVEFTEGESVHDVLQRVCKDAGIQMESSFTPAYNSAYVEGINNLYEFDCGQLSGWMYNVNGWFPNYGCSKYTVNDGDVINWVYTCDLGKDVGDNSMY